MEIMVAILSTIIIFIIILCFILKKIIKKMINSGWIRIGFDNKITNELNKGFKNE